MTRQSFLYGFEALAVLKAISDIQRYLLGTSTELELIIPELFNKRACYTFTLLTLNHGFFQDLNVHRLISHKALELPGLF